MSTVLDEVLAANKAYASEFGDRTQLPMPPGRRFAILTCMDARLDPAKFAGLAEGDAHVIRNAGGRASDDAIRSLVISHKLLGTREWFVIHHTDCGMETFTDATIRDQFARDVRASGVGQPRTAASEAEYIDWLTIRDQAASLADDVARIRDHPLVPKDIPIFAYLFDVKTGELVAVPEAATASALAS